MAMKLPTPVTHAPMRGLPFTSGSLSIGALRILARLLGDSASPAKSGITLERSRMPPLASMIPGFSRPCGPKRTSFMGRSLHRGGWCADVAGSDHASDVAWQARGPNHSALLDNYRPAGSDCAVQEPGRRGHCCPPATGRKDRAKRPVK